FNIFSNQWNYWTIDTSINVIVGVEREAQEIPAEFALSQNYPNPFNAASVIKYSIPKLSHVKLNIFNTLGEEIETVVNEEQSAGVYKVNWSAADLPSGVYFYQLHAGDFIETKKMILMK
ncbi:MAG: T9SS type A sorting domain-containing protein, partial [Ignavibacteria bacterium]